MDRRLSSSDSVEVLPALLSLCVTREAPTMSSLDESAESRLDDADGRC